MIRYKRDGEYNSIETEMPEVDAFLADIKDVCKKHKLSISHEDGHGAFIITKYDDELMKWLNEAVFE